MAYLNKVQLIGNLGQDPEVHAFPDGGLVANLTLATTERWKDKSSGEPREATEWHKLVLNGRLAEIAEQYLKKGAKVYVEGRLRTRKWEKEGQDHYTTEIRVDTLKMLGKKPASEAGEADEGEEETEEI